MKPERLRTLILTLLLVLTAAALLPWDPAGPFDARDYAAVPGMSLEYPAAAGLLEPLLAPGHLLLGAPDFRLAFGALAVWLALGALAWGWWCGGMWWRRGLRMTLAPLAAVWCLAAYVLFVSHVHFPGWRLAVADPDVIVSDLQSHTLGSHDGLVRAPVNLAWHAARGYDVAAITEHDDPAGSFYTRALAARQFPTLAVIPGIEVGSEYGGFLLGLGLREGAALPDFWADRTDYARHFIAAVRNQHEGAVISMAWRLDAPAIYALADAGVDGFEIANNGHPDIPADVRAAMLELERAGKVVLVSSTDWHGWGGFTRTWTVLRLPGAASMTADERAAAVVRALRERNTAAITPVVAGYLGPPSTLRLAFTPLVETLRYGAELSWSRVAGWWLWGVLLIVAAPIAARRGLNAARLLGIAWLGGVGGVLFWRGVEIYTTRAQGDVVLSDVTGELGAMAMYVGLPLLLAALVLAVGEWRRFAARRS
jgi:hypothetical protein